MSPATLERVLFRWMPGLVLAAAYAGIAVLAGTPWPWARVVHEDGVRTLLETVLFFEHATRELVPDLVLAAAIAGAVRFYFPPDDVVPATPAARWRLRLGLVAAGTIALILLGTLRTGGSRAVADNLSQLHTRAGAPLVWGAHWRYHLIERGAAILLAFAAAGAIWLRRGRPAAGAGPGRLTLYGGSVAAFAALTLLFHPTSEPFRDPRFLGHQARELFTHTLVTLPLALGVCLGMARRFSSPRGIGSAWSPWPIVLSGAASALAGGFLLVASLRTGAQSQGQTDGLAGLLFPHFAEHSLGYLLVPSLAGCLYLLPGTRRRTRSRTMRTP